jgi:hypothetical protein
MLDDRTFQRNVQIKRNVQDNAALPALSRTAWQSPEESGDKLGGNLQTPGAAYIFK